MIVSILSNLQIYIIKYISLLYADCNFSITIIIYIQLFSIFFNYQYIFIIIVHF